MSSLFDGGIVQYVIPLLLLLFFSLPEVLRKKRKYPPRKRMPQHNEHDETLPSAHAEKLPEIARPRHARPLPEYSHHTGNNEEARRMAYAAQEVTAGERHSAVCDVPLTLHSAAPHMVREEPWSELSPEARDIYAGIIWSELLEPPLARRRK